MAIDWKAKEAEEKSNQAKLAEIAPAVATALGLTIKPQDPDDFLNPDSVRMEGPAGEIVNLWANRYGAAHRGKVEISGGTYRVNPDRKAYVPAEVSTVAIYISLARTAEQIIADVKRRFWPAYMAELDAHRKARAAYDGDRASEKARAETLAAVIGAPVSIDDKGLRINVKGLRINVYRSRDLEGELADVMIRSEGVRFNRLDVSDAVAAEILRIMAREHKAPTE